MPHPVRYAVPSGPLLLAPKRVIPPLMPPPPPPPPSGIYKNMSTSLPGCWAPLGIVCGPGPIPLPIPAQSPSTSRELKERKLICIRDPSTGLDVTQEILHQSPPFQMTHNNHSQPLLPQSPFMELMFPTMKSNVSWFEPPQLLPPPLPVGGRSGSPPCLCCSSTSQPISWQELVGLAPRKAAIPLKQYSREFLLSLRYQPLSMTLPPGLPDLSRFTKSRSPCGQPGGDWNTRAEVHQGVLPSCYCCPTPVCQRPQRRGRGTQRTSFHQVDHTSIPGTPPSRSRSISLGQATFSLGYN